MQTSEQEIFENRVNFIAILGIRRNMKKRAFVEIFRPLLGQTSSEKKNPVFGALKLNKILDFECLQVYTFFFIKMYFTFKNMKLTYLWVRYSIVKIAGL